MGEQINTERVRAWARGEAPRPECLGDPMQPAALALCDAIDALRIERDALHRLLLATGKHLSDCDEGWDDEEEELTGRPCSCGLDTALGSP